MIVVVCRYDAVWVKASRGQSRSSAASAPHWCAVVRRAALRCSRAGIKVVSRRGTIDEPIEDCQTKSWNAGNPGNAGSSETSNNRSLELLARAE